MGKYDHYEELEEQAYNDRIRRKKKPKKQKKNKAINTSSRKRLNR